MNVAQVSFYVDPLGRSPELTLAAWPTLTDTARATARLGCRVTVFQAARQAGRIEHDGVTYDFLRIPAWPFGRWPQGTRWIRGVRQLCSAIARTRPDVIHVHGLAAPVQTRLLTSRFPKVATLAQDHASRPAPGLRRRLYKWGFAGLSAVVFTAREQALPFVQARILSRDMPVFEVIEGSSTFTPGDQAAARDKTGLYGDPCVLWVGRLDANKDPVSVLDAVDRVIPQLPGIRLWCLYSDGPLLAAVERRLAGSPLLQDRVRLLGNVPHDQIEDFYRAADLFTLASRSEGSGYALLEALACGVSPLVTAIPSFHRITGGGEVGELFEPGDRVALADGLIRFASRDRAQLQKQVRHYFEHSLSYDAIGHQWLDTYDSLRAEA